MQLTKVTERLFLLAGIVSITLLSCSKDDDSNTQTPAVSLSVQDGATLSIKDSVIVNADVTGVTIQEQSWMVNDSLYSNKARLAFKAPLAGAYKIVYTGTAGTVKLTKQIQITVQPTVRPVTGSSSKYISKIFDYQPAPGQWINESVGTPDGAQNIIGGTSALVSLGAYGGYVVFGFDHSIVNQTGADLAIYGNPAKAPQEWSEPGIVLVSQDVNDNGIPDDPWYELAGSEYSAATTIKHYRITYYNPKATANVTWKDNQGHTGEVEINSFHQHSYYPSFAANQDSISFEGTVMRNTFSQLDGTAIFINTGFAWGYADNYATDATKDPYATNLYNAFDLDWAVDNGGKAIKLGAVDFVKIYTGQNHKGSAELGEISAEIRGAADLNMK